MDLMVLRPLSPKTKALCCLLLVVFCNTAIASEIRDETPAFRAQESEARETALRFLQDHSENEIQSHCYGKASYLQLAAQSDAYRGKIVALSGVFLRCDSGEITGRDSSVTKIYDCWLRMDDQHSKPLSVVSLTEPEGFSPGERVHVFGRFFKRRLYSDGNEPLSTPMLFAKSIQRGPLPEHIVTQNDTPVPQEEEKLSQDSGFLREIFALTEEQWNRLESLDFTQIEAVTENDGETLARILRRLRQRHVLRLLNEHSESFSRENVQKMRLGVPVKLTRKTSVQQVRTVSLPGISETLYLCEMRLENGASAFCLTPQVPKKWGLSTTDTEPREIEEQIAFTGILVARTPQIVFLTPKLQWYPNTLLGKYGMDMATLDAVPALPLDKLFRKSNSGETSSQELDLNSLRFSEADHEPFYQMLTTAVKIPATEINRELREGSYEYFPVIDLFNRPHTQQGNLVRVRGNARRIDRVLIEDPEVKKRFGLSSYYQITFFTPDSQGNPLVCCIAAIPPGLPLGSETEFNVPITLSAFFYKTWSYRKLMPPNEKSTESVSPLASEQFAPLLIGAKIDSFEVPTPPGAEANESFPFARSATVFLVLVVIWVLLRRFGGGSAANRSGPRFQMPE